MTELKRSRVMRMDGRLINLVHHRRHLLICAKGCGILTLTNQTLDGNARLSFDSIYGFEYDG
jgi:hypothetical protein